MNDSSLHVRVDEFYCSCLFWFVVFVGRGVWWMPWYQVPMKDVTAGDSPGELASVR